LLLFINNNKRGLVGIHKSITNALNTQWALTDEWVFTFNNTRYQLNAGMYAQDIWDICTINIDSPQFGAPVNDTVIGGTRRFYTSIYNSFSLSVTFRDIMGMKLKEYFTKIWAAQNTKYFDDIKSTVQLSERGNIIFHSDDCLISDISQSQFSNDNNQIIEFTVTFMCTSFSNNELGGFGKPGRSSLR
jgi:hypothetical protein